VSDLAVRVRGLRVEREGTVVLEDVDVDVPRGAFVGLCGPNGAGKTTLLRVLLGLVRPTRGTALVLGAPAEARRAAGGVGYVPQRHAIVSTFPARVEDVVAMGTLHRRRGLRRLDAEARRAARQVLAQVGIAELARRPVGRLSGGEQRRVALAQALVAGRELLVLDEPTVGLDLPAEHEFYALLRRLQAELGLTVIAVSHDLLALAGAADQLLCINRRVHAHGNPEEVVHSHALQEAYSCEFDFLAGEIDHHARHGRGG
jgi:zinc transport system ATP-binding protein